MTHKSLFLIGAKGKSRDEDGGLSLVTASAIQSNKEEKILLIQTSSLLWVCVCVWVGDARTLNICKRATEALKG